MSKREKDLVSIIVPPVKIVEPTKDTRDCSGPDHKIDWSTWEKKNN